MTNNPENIQVGDLVMVVRPTPCCKVLGSVGKVFTVSAVETTLSKCPACGDIGELGLVKDKSGSNWDTARLKKIDPPEEGDSLPTRKDIEDKETA